MKLAKENMSFDELNLEIQANSPYNDGWTQQFYKDELKKVKTQEEELNKKIRNALDNPLSGMTK